MSTQTTARRAALLFLYLAIFLFGAAGSVLALVQGPGPHNSTGTVIPGGMEPPIEAHNGYNLMDSFVVWGMRQFDAAGLSRPKVRSVTFLSDRGRCQGYMGWVQDGRDGPEVTLCFQPEDACSDADCNDWNLKEKLALLHELSHAWLSQNLSSARETDFIRFEGLQSWQDFGVDWYRRGVEQAAITMARVLSTESLPLTMQECEKQTEGFRILTGAAPPAPCPV